MYFGIISNKILVKNMDYVWLEEGYNIVGVPQKHLNSKIW